MNEELQSILGQHSILLDAAIVSAGLSVFFFILAVHFLKNMVIEEDRTYMDPLPFGLRLIWPFIQIISFFFCSLLPYELMERVEKRLQHTGVSYLLTSEQFVALRIISTAGGFLFGLLLINALKGGQPIWVLFTMILGFVLPDIWLNDTRKRRESAVIRAMPIYLDFITMAVEAGLNLQSALGQAMEKAPPSPLRKLWKPRRAVSPSPARR
jgi:tight adherence protein C